MRYPAVLFLSFLLLGANLPEADSQASAGLPQRIGECVRTTITLIHPRMRTEPWTDEQFNWGTGVQFANGGRQVSYEREEAILASRPGDKVVMCLISIPRGCPPRDDRGREYFVTNERTGQKWELPDSQHYCGGA